ASLRTGIRLPAGRVPLEVYKDLISRVLSAISWSIWGAVSICLPALREAATAWSARVVRVLALAQHHADRRAGQVKGLTQRVDEIAAIGVRQIGGLGGEECEGRRAGVDLGDVAQAQPAAADERRRVALLGVGEPAIEIGSRHTPVPHRVGGEDG